MNYHEYELSAATPGGSATQTKAGMLWLFNSPEPLFSAVQNSPQTFVIRTASDLVGALSIDPRSGKMGFYPLGRPPSLYALASVQFPIFGFPNRDFDLELKEMPNYFCKAKYLKSFNKETPPFGNILKQHYKVAPLRGR